MTDGSTRRWLWVAAALFFIGLLTLQPEPENPWIKRPWCWSCSASGDTADFVLNVVLFVPLGLALRGAGLRRRSAMIAAVLATLVVETLQYFVVTGRDASIRDVVANSLGGALGFAVTISVSNLWSPNRVVARRLAWGAATMWMAHAVFSLFASQPAMTANQLYAQIAPRLSIYDAFDGRVGPAAVNDATVFSGPFPDGFTAESWRHEPIDLSITVQGGTPTPRYAPILALVDAAPIEIASLGENQGDLTFRSRTRADAWQLRPPFAVVPSVFPAADRAVIRGKRVGWTLVASVQSADGSTREASLALRPAVAWMFWWPFGVPGVRVVAVVTLLWLAVPFFAIGFWSMRASGARPVVVAPIVVAGIVAHVAAPLAFRVDSLGTWSDAAPMVIGAVCGLALGALHKSRSGP